MVTMPVSPADGALKAATAELPTRPYDMILYSILTDTDELVSHPWLEKIC